MLRAITNLLARFLLIIQSMSEREFHAANNNTEITKHSKINLKFIVDILKASASSLWSFSCCLLSPMLLTFWNVRVFGWEASKYVKKSQEFSGMFSRKIEERNFWKVWQCGNEDENFAHIPNILPFSYEEKGLQKFFIEKSEIFFYCSLSFLQKNVKFSLISKRLWQLRVCFIFVHIQSILITFRHF